MANHPHANLYIYDGCDLARLSVSDSQSSIMRLAMLGGEGRGGRSSGEKNPPVGQLAIGKNAAHLPA